MPICYIGLGSNLGNRRKNIKLAIVKINNLKDTRVVKASSNIETKPLGGPPQGEFLNSVIEIETGLSPRRLLAGLQNIEQELGRKRAVKNGPRTIDLDILIFNNRKINEKGLIVPHPRILQREFVLGPLKEIAPDIARGLLNEDNQRN